MIVVLNGFGAKIAFTKLRDGLSVEDVLAILFIFTTINAPMAIIFVRQLGVCSSDDLPSNVLDQKNYVLVKVFLAVILALVITPLLVMLGCGIWVSSCLSIGLGFVIPHVIQGIRWGPGMEKR
jgi:uncharacterized membrane protein